MILTIYFRNKVVSLRQGFSFFACFPHNYLLAAIFPPTLQPVYVCLLPVRSWDRGHGPAGDDGHPVRSGDEEGHVPHRLPAIQGAALQAHGHPQVGSPWRILQDTHLSVSDPDLNSWSRSWSISRFFSEHLNWKNWAIFQILRQKIYFLILKMYLVFTGTSIKDFYAPGEVSIPPRRIWSSSYMVFPYFPF